MLFNRLIPVLLVHDDGLWKTEQFELRTYVGDPTNAVRIFSDKMADEIIVLDIDASRKRRGPNFPLIERIASECAMPLCYGGGITTVDQARRLFSLGVEKVSLNAAARSHTGLISEIAEIAGRQAVVASVDVAGSNGAWHLYAHEQRSELPQDWVAVARACRDAGAGELLIGSVDRDGTLAGPDVPLVGAAAAAVDIPVIALGGVRDLDDAAELVSRGASAVAAGAMFVYRGPHRAVLISYPDIDQLHNQHLLTA